MLRFLLLISLTLAMSFPVYAELDLKPVNPDEDAEYTYNQRFSKENALQRLEQIESALQSFTQLTDVSRKLISKEELKKIGNTSGEIQSLGFMNWPGAIKGTILKQDYLIAKLRYDLAQKRLKLGEINKGEVLAAQKEYEKAERVFQTYWNSFGVGD